MHSAKLFVLLNIIVCIESIPKIGTPCKKHDTLCFINISNELYKGAIAGDPALGVEVMDPAYNDLIQGTFGTLQYKLYNTTLLGFKNCVVTNSTLTEDHSALSFVMRCPLLNMEGEYESKGDIFSIYIDGTGHFTLECKDYFVTVDAKIKTLKRKDGKEYLALQNFKANGDLIGGMKFHMDNLFDGQKELEELFYRVVYQNWKEVSTELQVLIVDIYVKRAIININKIFKAITLEEILVDE